MKKTSVYLTEREAEILRRIAEDEGKSQATVLREALAAYDARPMPNRDFAMFRDAFEPIGDRRSVAGIPEDELMKGFGQESMGEDSK